MDTGRGDAAPRDRGGDRGGQGSGSGVAGSSFRSENNFGTSAVVPGDPRAGDGGGADGEGEGAAGAGGTGTSDQGSGIDLSGSSLDTGDTSGAQNYLLLAVLAAGGILLGIASARARSLN